MRKIALTAVAFITLLWIAAPADAFIRGDVDGSGDVNPLVDGLALFNFGFIPGSPEPPCLDAADFNDDGSVNALADGIGLLNFGFIPGSPPPALPYPDDGVDPTDDMIPDGDCGGMAGGPIPFVDVAQGNFSGAPEQTTIIRDQGAWDAFWNQHDPNSPQPAIDFSEEMVVIVLREFFSGGYFVQIDEIVDTGSGIEVHYTQGEPLTLCPVILIFTQPYHIVAAQLVDGDPIAMPTVVDSCP